jgi:hypothetical protein
MHANHLIFKRVVEYVVTNLFSEVRFEVLSAGSMKMAVIWVVVPRRLVQVCRSFKGTWCLSTLMMGAAITSETSVNIYRITLCYNPADSHLIIFGAF